MMKLSNRDIVLNEYSAKIFLYELFHGKKINKENLYDMPKEIIRKDIDGEVHYTNVPMEIEKSRRKFE